jgi:hypothetical protein
MNTVRVLACALTVSACVLACAHRSQANELDGAWANSETACGKVFVKRNNRMAIARDSDIYGSGFIIEGNRIRGKIVTCTIKTRKQDGAVLHLIATCSTDTALQNVQFSLKLDGKDTIVRMFPGVPELDTPYFRCSL